MCKLAFIILCGTSISNASGALAVGVTPNAKCICLLIIMIPMAASIPLITADGIKSPMMPARATPNRIWIAPARKTASAEKEEAVAAGK